MRIAAITNWAYGATVLLTVVSGVTTFLASGSEDRERAAVAQRARFDQLTASVEEDTLRLTEQAREYVISGDQTNLIVYRREAAHLQSVEARIAHLRDAGATYAELNTLRQALHWADALHDEQQAAIRAKQAGDEATARKILFGAEYERELDRVGVMIDRFQYMIDGRTEMAVAEATRASRTLRTMSEVMLGVTAFLFLCVLYFIIKQRILRPVVRLSDIVSRLAANDFDVTPSEYTHVDEIGDMAQAVEVFRRNGLERQRLEQERDADQAVRDMLARMMQRLQGCDSMTDLIDVVSHFAPRIAPSFAGRLYILDGRRNCLVETCNWSSPADSVAEFPPNACWALRRGQIHRPEGDAIDIPCGHLAMPEGRHPTCVPLIAQGDIIGLLYFEQRECGSGNRSASDDRYLEILAENVGMALANLNLRERLREMALVDPLTGIANRRRFDAALAADIGEAERTGSPLSCLMVDIDHFKKFNDMYGHDAGDAVLRQVGHILQNAAREDALAARFGGEEFVLLLPGFNLERAHARAEQIRQSIIDLRVEHEGRPLGPVTASFGLATTPDHGRPDTLLRTADAALLRAKTEGRDRIVVATIRESRSVA